MKLIPLIFSCLFFLNICHAQLAKSIHQSFEIEERNTVSVNLKGDVEIQTWAGNTILTETKVKLYDASPGILNYFVKLGRYEIENKDNTNGIHLSSKDIIRRPIRTKTGECFEEVKVQVFLPDDFVAETETVWKRKIEDETSISLATDSIKTDNLIQQDSLKTKKSLEKQKDDN